MDSLDTIAFDLKINASIKWIFLLIRWCEVSNSKYIFTRIMLKVLNTKKYFIQCRNQNVSLNLNV